MLWLYIVFSIIALVSYVKLFCFKKDVDLQYGETSGTNSSKQSKGLDDNRISNDAEYRSAYLKLRQQNPMTSRDSLTDTMVRNQMAKMGFK